MSRRIFIDVGGHRGWTLGHAVNPRWRFDRIWVFEPARSCLPVLRTAADDRTEIVNAGWWTSDTELELHDPGTVGASVIAGKARTETVERCQFIDAARWMTEHIRTDDVVWMHLNCEAAEVAILDRLLETGELYKVSYLHVQFDVEKVPGMRYQAAEMRARLESANIPFTEAKQFASRSGLSNWLRWTEASPLVRWRCGVLNPAICRVRQRLYPLKVAFRRFRSRRAGEGGPPGVGSRRRDR